MARKNNKNENSEEKRQIAFAEIHKKMCHVRNKQDTVNEALEQLQKFVEKDTNLLIAKNKVKSINLHSNLLKTSESHCEYLRKLLHEIERLRNADYKSKMRGEIKRRDLMELIQSQGETLPLWINVVDGFPGEGVGAIAITDCSKMVPGDAVAAYSGDNWILAEIVSCQGNGKYECRDVDDEQKKVSIFSRQKLASLPKWRADPKHDKHALFPPDAIVLALYPQTTCFYKGVVHSTPSTATDSYQIAFDDASYPCGYSPPMSIPQRYVISYREVRGGRRKDDDDE
ncbi:unnamed protein product [Caenorhabditis bovis]|uniref:SGF29 C-terminal domain-containing protein n=1 Tax=Caenorhabditis bovis TaxID=2654633 RepID=A0A8S1EYD6_9PELO|nr:unnamed protein product [Caenorhabditis bovis]